MAELDKAKLDAWITREPEYSDAEAYVGEGMQCTECGAELRFCDLCNEPFEESDDIMCCVDENHYHINCYDKMYSEEEY